MFRFLFGRREFIQLLGTAAISPFHSQILPSISTDPSRQASSSGTATQQSSATGEDSLRVFRVPGSHYRNIVQNFVVEFLNHYNAKKDYPIERIFRIFPFQITDRGKAKQLIDRGTIKFQANAAKNSGDKVEVTFVDENVGKLAVVFKAEMIGSLSNLTARGFRLSFSGLNQVPVVFYKLDPKYEMGPNQTLEAVDFGPDAVSYTLHEVNNEVRKIRIDVDLKTAGPAQKPVAKPAHSALLNNTSMTLASFAATGMATTRSTSQSQDADACRDTRPFVGPIRCNCCGGHEANGQPCADQPGQTLQFVDYDMTFVNRSGLTLYVYYQINKGGGVFDCLNFTYGGQMGSGGSFTRTIKAGYVGWFKFQTDTEGNGCPLSNNKYESWAYSRTSSDPQTLILY